MVEKEAKNKARKAPLTDSEGLKVATVHDETEDTEEPESLNKAAKEAYEEEVRAAEEEAERNRAEWEGFLADR